MKTTVLYFGVEYQKGISKMEKQSGYNSNYRAKLMKYRDASRNKGLCRVEVVVPVSTRGQVLELARQLRQEFKNPALRDGSTE